MTLGTRSCTATRKDGSPCTAPALPSSRLQRCFAHDDTAVAARSAGGKGRATAARASKALPPQLRQMETRLLDLVDELGSETTKPATAMAIVAAVGKLLDLSKFSLEVGEQKELAERLALLEDQTAVGARRA